MSIVTDRKYETQALVNLLSSAKAGDTITYEQMSACAGSEVSSSTGFLASARRIAQRDHNCVFVAVKNVGLKRATDVELATDVSDADVRRSRRHARRAFQKLNCVESFGSLPNPAQIEHVIKASFFGTVASLAKKTRLNALATAAQGRSSQLPMEETLRHFLRKK